MFRRIVSAEGTWPLYAVVIRAAKRSGSHAMRHSWQSARCCFRLLASVSQLNRQTIGTDERQAG
jgi:hypothetical protein